MEFKPYFVFGIIILYLLYYFISNIAYKYKKAKSIEENKEEERIIRIQKINRIKDFIIKQRLKGAGQWHSPHN